LVTIKDIGKAIGVSHATVSRALNDSPLVNKETRDLVRKTANEMGYLPDHAARILRGSTSNIVGFVLPDIRNHFYSRIASIVGQHASDSGLQLVLATTDDDPAREERHLAELQRARARAVIITPTERLTQTSAEILGKLHTLQMVRRHPALSADLVVADDRQGVADITRYLLSRGHKRIAYVGGGSQTLSTGQERVDGYNAAMAEAGLGAFALSELGPPQPGFGYQATRRLLAQDTPPQAIVLGSSQLTIGFLDAVRESGLRVPAQLSFTGYDDPDWFAHWGAGITTVQLPVEQIARAVAALAAGERGPQPGARIEGDDAGLRTILFPCHVVERGSVAEPAGV